MRPVTKETWAAYEGRLERTQVPAAKRPSYHKWTRFYLDFCQKYGHAPRSPTTLGPFLAKLASKNQSVEQRNQAAQAINLLIGPNPRPNARVPQQPAGLVVSGATAECAHSRVVRAAAEYKQAPPGVQVVPPVSTVRNSPAARPVSACTSSGPVPGRGTSWEREYRELEGSIKLRNYSRKTFDAYRHWVGKFQGFVRSRPSSELGSDEVKGFLSELAVRHGVAASTQNQAFNALLFFYRHVLGREFGKLEGVVRAKRHRYVPVVLSHAETEAIVGQLKPPYQLVALLLYGCGLRLAECVNLRVHCFNLDAMLLTIHDGKGQKDRTVPLPARALPEVRKQLELVRRLHAQDLASGYGGTLLPRQLEKKYKNAAKELIWQWFFPAPSLTFVRDAREPRRYHLHESHVQGAVKEAAGRAGILKRVSPHTFRHTFASHLLLANYDLQTIQKLLGHGDVKTTMIYLQTVPSVTLKEARSPLDLVVSGRTILSGECKVQSAE